VESSQLELGLGESAGSCDAPRSALPPVTVEKHVRAPSRKRRLEAEYPDGKFPEHLPREVRVLDEGEEAGEVITTKITERLCVRPSELYVEEIRRVVRKNEEGEISQPPVPATPLPRRCVDASFLAHIILMKFLWHMPLYRQERMFRAQGVNISRETLIRYVIEVARLLGRLYNTLLASVFEAEVVFGDETPVLVGKGVKGQRSYSASRFWPFLGGGASVFIFARTRAAKEIEPYLSSYKGFLQVDGYKVYETIARAYPEIVLVFCWAHARRKFIEAQAYYPAEAKQALRYIGLLYTVEDRAKGQGSERVSALRARFSKRILALFKLWLDEKLSDPRLLPKSTLGEAVGYVLARWKGLCRYTEDPRLSIDSNPVEREIRPVALGRKNWLFCASETGAEAACVLYSLIASCKLAGVDPNAYLVDVLNRINDHSQLRLSELLPQNWKPIENIPENGRPGP
jgi:transposase